MNAEQKSTIRENAQAIADIAYTCLGRSCVIDENARAYLTQIVGRARSLLEMVGPPASPWSATTHRCPSCGNTTRDTTAGCDHCDLDDK